MQNLIIVADFSYIDGGSQKVAIQTAEFMKDRYNVFFFTQQDNEKGLHEQVWDREGVEVISSGMVCSKNSRTPFLSMLNAVYNFRAASNFKKFLKRFSVSDTIIHVHTWGRIASSSVIHVALTNGFKVIVTLHDYLTVCPTGNLFNYQTLQICDIKPFSCKCLCTNCITSNRVIRFGKQLRGIIQNKVIHNDNLIFLFVSDFSWNIMKKFDLIYHNPARCFLVPNPMIITRSKKRIECEKNELFLYVGNLDEFKGIDVFCEAVYRCNLKACVIGTGPRFSVLVKKYPCIEFKGWCDKSTIDAVYQKTRAFIFPSLLYETLGLSPAEALVNGIPVVVSADTAFATYINTGVNGIKFDTGNVTLLADILMKLANSDDFVKTLSECAFKTTLEGVIQSPDEYKKQLVKIYSEMLSDK